MHARLVRGVWPVGQLPEFVVDSIQRGIKRQIGLLNEPELETQPEQQLREQCQTSRWG